MTHVATRRRDWTLRLIYEGLFDYCFPEDFKRQLRWKLMHATQGNRKVRDFVRELERLAERFPDVNHQHLVEIFWQGLESYLQFALLEKGLDPESSTLELLVEQAARSEKAYAQAWKSKRDFSSRVPGRQWGRFAARNNATAPSGPELFGAQPRPSSSSNLRPNSSQTRPSGSGSGQPRAAGNASNLRSQNNPQRHPDHHETSRRDGGRDGGRTRISRAERDQMQAEGRCFNCRNTGHEARNCPDRKTAPPPPGLRNGSIRVGNLDHLAAEARAVDLGSISLTVSMDTDFSGSESDEDADPVLQHQIETSRRLEQLFQRYYSADEAMRSGMPHTERFSAYCIGADSYQVTDWVTGPDVPHLVLAADFDDWDGLVHRVVQRTIDDTAREYYPREVAEIRTEAYRYLHVMGYRGPLWIDVIPDRSGFVVRVLGTRLACVVTQEDVRSNNRAAFSYLAHEC